MTERLAKVREGVWEWTKEWGLVGNWALRFDDELAEARDARKVDSWITDTWIMAATGQALLRKLKEVAEMEWAVGQNEVKDAWHQSFDLMGILQEGVMLLEARLVANGMRM